jgi:hypothetical protein
MYRTDADEGLRGLLSMADVVFINRVEIDHGCRRRPRRNGR